MLVYIRTIKVILLSISLTVVLSSKAFCGDLNLFDGFQQGNWRYESQAGFGLSGGDWSDRKGDYYFSGSLEYEWPISLHTNLGLRGYPAIIYHQEKNDKRKTDTIFGEAFGLVVRHYENENRQEGFYFEVGFSAMWNSRLFRRNASHWNGLSEVGIGYEFDSSWHIALKFQHISNGGISYPNAGVNALALCLGFTF